MSSAIQETADRLTGVEEELDKVRRELAEQRIVVKQLLSRVDATAAYYEQRVDLIYRRVSIALREMMGYGNIDSVSELEAEAVLSKTMRAFDVPFSVPEQLRRAVSGELLPGRIESPLSLHGFRVNRRRARETGTGIEMYGNETGIAIYGPYKLLRPGEYEISAPLERSGSTRSKPDHGSLVIDVFGSEKQIVAAVGDLSPFSTAETCSLRLRFSWEGGVVEIRLSNNTGVPWLLKEVGIERVG
jgi:hypothetical protein